MEFEDPDWRFNSPGAVLGDVRSSIGFLINDIALQGHRKAVFETFKRRFAPIARTENRDGPTEIVFRNVELTVTEVGSNKITYVVHAGF